MDKITTVETRKEILDIIEMNKQIVLMNMKLLTMLSRFQLVSDDNIERETDG